VGSLLASTIQVYPKEPSDRPRWAAARQNERIFRPHPEAKPSDAASLRSATPLHGEDLLRLPVLNPDCALLPIPDGMPPGILTSWC